MIFTNKKYFLLASLVALTACQSVGTSQQGIFTPLTITTSRCFGTCPVYSVTIHQGGSINFDGKTFVSHKGKAIRVIKATQAQDILRKANVYKPAKGTGADNFNCQPMATDHPSYNLTWKSSTEKTVYNHYTGCLSPGDKKVTLILKNIIKSLGIDDLIKNPVK